MSNSILVIIIANITVPEARQLFIKPLLYSALPVAMESIFPSTSKIVTRVKRTDGTYNTIDDAINADGEDTGSDLCFAIALLDFEDTGVVINGIYSRDGSSTYAKPVEKGTSTYTLSTEEIQAIDMAKRNAGTYFANV